VASYIIREAPAIGSSGEHPIAGAGGYSFGLIDEKVEGSQQIEITTTDEHGHADIKLAVEPPPGASTAPLKAFDLGRALRAERASG